MIKTQVVRRCHDEVSLLGQLFQHIAIGNVGSRADQRSAQKVDQRTGLAKVGRWAQDVVVLHFLPLPNARLERC